MNMNILCRAIRLNTFAFFHAKMDGGSFPCGFLEYLESGHEMFLFSLHKVRYVRGEWGSVEAADENGFGLGVR